MCRRLGFRQTVMPEGAPRAVQVLDEEFRMLQAHPALAGFVGPRDPAA